MPPISTMLPKGCSSVRGASMAPRITSVGGQLARNANRFYMLNVKRESLRKKKESLKDRLSDITRQIAQLDRDIRSAQAEYEELHPRRKRKTKGNGSSRKMKLEF